MITNTPIVKISALILQRDRFFPVINTQSLHFMTTETLLYFPTGHIRIYQRCFRCNQSSTRTYYNDRNIRLCNFFPCSVQFLHIKIISQAQICYITKQYIGCHKALRHLYQHIFRFIQITYQYYLRGDFCQFPHQFILINSCITINSKNTTFFYLTL